MDTDQGRQMFKKGDRVSEDGLVGTVTKMHSNGKVVDVLFDGEEYARRRQVGDVMKKNPRKPSRKKYGVAISGKFKGFTKSAGGQLKAGIFETKKYGTVFFPAANFNTNWLLFKHSYYSPNIDILIADRGTIQNFDSVSPSDFRYIQLAKGKDILVLPEWLANKKGLENESASEKKVLKSKFSDHFTLPSQQPKQNPTRYFFRMNPKNVPEYIPQTPRSRATSRYVFPKQKSYPIGDLYHARSALVFALSPTNESKRKKVLNAVAKLYPMYNWSKWWNKRAKGKRDVKPWSFYVKKKQPARRERMLVAANPKQYTTHLPLIIGCGASKNPGKLPANQKYAKGYWATYRANTPSMPNQDAATYVLSAKYGIIPETQEITSYDKVIVPSSKRTLKPNEVRASTVANKLANQLEPQVVMLVGGEAYAEALELAGFTPIMVENLSEFPGKKARGGMGKKNAALKWFISDFLPSRRPITPQRVGSRRRGATTSSVVANLSTQDGIVKTLYQIRVNGIYKGEVRRALGLRSNASFGKGRKRLDLRLPRAERRKLLNLAFGAATQAMRKEGLLAKSGSKNMFRLSKNKFKLLVDKNQSRTENYYTSRIAEFEKALELTRKTK